MWISYIIVLISFTSFLKFANKNFYRSKIFRHFDAKSFRREQLVHDLHNDAKDSHDPSEVSGMETLNFGRDNLIYLSKQKKFCSHLRFAC